MYIVFCLASCSGGALKPEPPATPLSEFTSIVDRTIIHSRRTIQQCQEAFKVHYEVLDETSTHKPLNDALSEKVAACDLAVTHIREKILPLREKAVVFFNTQKQTEPDSAETPLSKEHLNTLIRMYASLMASMKIGSEEAEAFITPLKVHSLYIANHGIPEDRNLIEEEKKYVYKRYRIYRDELLITLKEAKNLSENLTRIFQD
jgi:hypothetical protein